jgi:L-ascorbate metabolism protein UlaG (beta-lactamase superfamily)
MKIEWKGHSSFLFTTLGGIEILTDPFNEDVGYPLPKVEPDYVTISHQHYDHNFIKLFNQSPNKPIIIKDQEAYSFPKNRLQIEGFASFHDMENGTKRGPNTIYKISTENLAIAHLGDLGHILTDKQLSQLGTIDILCIPVGGFFTINAEEAHKIIELLKPSVVLPMHYKYASYVQLPIASLDEFKGFYPNIEQLDVLTIEKDNLIPQKIQVIQLSCKNPQPQEHNNS